MKPRNSAGLFATGTCTRWLASITHWPPTFRSQKLMATPIATIASGAGMGSLCRNFTRSHASISTRDRMPTAVAPGWKSNQVAKSSEKVFWLSGCKNESSPIGSAS